MGLFEMIWSILVLAVIYYAVGIFMEDHVLDDLDAPHIYLLWPIYLVFAFIGGLIGAVVWAAGYIRDAFKEFRG